MYSFLVDDNSEQKKKGKGGDKNVAATISYSEYKNVFLNSEYLRR